MKVWFLNVGHGDCTLIEHASGRLTMIDINNSQDYDPETRQEILSEQSGGKTLLASFMDWAAVEATEARELTDPVDFLKTNFPGRPLWRFILTHPDLDHMRGLKKLLDHVRVQTFWDTKHTKPTPTFRGAADREDWEAYQSLRTGKSSAYGAVGVRIYHRGDALYAFGADEFGGGGDNIQILSPTPQLVQTCNQRGLSNDLSYVLRVSHAGRSLLLPGDAEALAWDQLVQFYGQGLQSDVLKASHHGRDSGFHAAAMKMIQPAVVISSVGRKPSTDAHSRYRNCGCRSVSTRRHGNIFMQVDDLGRVTWDLQRNGHLV